MECFGKQHEKAQPICPCDNMVVRYWNCLKRRREKKKKKKKKDFDKKGFVISQTKHHLFQRVKKQHAKSLTLLDAMSYSFYIYSVQ